MEVNAMSTDREQLDVNIPSAATAVVAEFHDREHADRAVETLTKQGFGTDQISLVARGAGEYDGKFQPGVLMLTVHSGGKDIEVMEQLRRLGAHSVRTGVISATGDVLQSNEAEETAGR